nr:MAG TPA: hypothetical protein [Caudoviricetes sp.]
MIFQIIPLKHFYALFETCNKSTTHVIMTMCYFFHCFMGCNVFLEGYSKVKPINYFLNHFE